MSFLVYFFVLLVAAGSVLFGLDWLQAPMPPMPPSRHAVPVASAPAKLAATAAKQDAKQQDAKLSPVYPARPGVPKPAQIDAAKATPVQSPASAATAGEPAAQTADAGAPAKCDVDACATAYHSFRASDCTYQPRNGPRRLCEKGTVPGLDRTTAAAQAPEARAQASCNVAACQRAYSSFNASDCTYQPYNGARRMCEK